MLIDVTRVEPLNDYKIVVDFSDGKRGIFDMTSYLNEGQFRKLRDIELFNAVRVECFTATWPGGIDIAPERLYSDCVMLES